MSIVPASHLSGADLALLGNNIRPASRRESSELAAVNRSLAVHQDSVESLDGSNICQPAWPINSRISPCRPRSNRK
jgi:hypothetical protein